MSADKLVFDLANEVEASPSVFVRKDWISILDNQNGNYNANQCVLDTSQLSNSNKYMGYREGYLAVPLLMTLSNAATGTATNGGFLPVGATTSPDWAIGLKNWFGTIIHSLTLDYNGTTIIQQTPYINMWNSFKLMTSLSWQDVEDFGSTMGFFPDDPLSFSYVDGETVNPGLGAEDGRGVCNNTNMCPPVNCLGYRVGALSGNAGANNDISTRNNYLSALGNKGFVRRQANICYDPYAIVGVDVGVGVLDYETSMLSGPRASSLWKSYVSNRQNGVNNGVAGIQQWSIMAFVHLRHIHSFFNQCPLIKGAFMKLTMNLNNCSTNFTIAGDVYTAVSVSNAVGGVNPLMLASRRRTALTGYATVTGPLNGSSTINYDNGARVLGNGTYIASLAVGSRVLNSTQSSLAGIATGQVSTSVILYVPAYSFNSVFESAYVSSPIKKIVYEDVYQYQVQGIGAGGNINNLITNGIANLKSALILPFYSSSGTITDNQLANTGIPVYQSPFDPAGTGPTSPLCLLSNFNVVVSGQNSIYNTERYSFEQFINQTYGCNSVNAGITDGLSSSLISQQGWEMEYCYHYVDIGRMLPVEQQVPKSVQVVGLNTSPHVIDLFVFLAYQCEISFDVISGARV